MSTDPIDNMDSADEALKTALAIADLLSCKGDTGTPLIFETLQNSI